MDATGDAGHNRSPTLAWLVIAVGLALGQWLTLALRRIPPGQELEEIAT